jgi:hypothetical protein
MNRLPTKNEKMFMSDVNESMSKVDLRSIGEIIIPTIYDERQPGFE